MDLAKTDTSSPCFHTPTHFPLLPFFLSSPSFRFISDSLDFLLVCCVLCHLKVLKPSLLSHSWQVYGFVANKRLIYFQSSPAFWEKSMTMTEKLWVIRNAKLLEMVGNRFNDISCRRVKFALMITTYKSDTGWCRTNLRSHLLSSIDLYPVLNFWMLGLLLDIFYTSLHLYIWISK